MTAADVPYCKDLAAGRGWLRDDERWALLVDVGDVYGVDAPDGGLAGAVVLTRYGPKFAAIGMLLVAQRYARQGLGTRLMRHSLEQVDGVVQLTATENGRPLYEKLGFEALGTCTAYLGRPPEGPGLTRPAVAADMRGLVDLDAETFGADRAHLLARLPAFAKIRVADRAYGAAWRNGGLTMIGPVVADDVTTAQALITDLATGDVRLDITSFTPELEAWAARHLKRGASTTFMTHGGPPPGDQTRLYTPFSVATG